MPDADTTIRDADRPTTRRAIIGAGLSIGAIALLAGCGSSTRGRSSSSIPGVPWDQQHANNPGSTPTRTGTTTRPGPINQPPAASTQTTTAAKFPGLRERQTWTSVGLANPGNANAMRGIRRITLHHDGMPAVAIGSTGDVASRLSSIRQYHASQGWADIGYHYIIDPLGNVWEGRPEAFQGAHVKDYNEHNLGILVLGNYEVQRPTANAMGTLERFLSYQMRQHRVSLRDVRTHREYSVTACPGRNLQPQIDRLRVASSELRSLA